MTNAFEQRAIHAYESILGYAKDAAISLEDTVSALRRSEITKSITRLLLANSRRSLASSRALIEGNLHRYRSCNGRKD